MSDTQTFLSPQPTSEVKGKFFLLFIFLLIYLIVYPYAGDYGIRHEWFRLLGLLITIASIYAVSSRRLTWIIALIFATPVALHRTILAEPMQSKLQLAGLILSAAFDVYVIVVIFHRVFRTRQVNSQAIYGAVSIYLMSGFAFARIYSFLDALQPTAFYLDPILNRHTRLDHGDMIYYSFGTMTTVGAAGIAPVSAQARSLSMIEAILGILYLGVLVARLLAMYHPGLPPDSADAQ
jgi:ion channel